MKNLYQLIPDQGQREAAIIDLKFARKILGKLVNGDETVDPTLVVYIGFLLFGFVELSKTDKNATYKMDAINALSRDYHERAMVHSKKKGEVEGMSLEKQKVEREKIDLKYAQSLMQDWIKNKKVNPNDAMYIGYLTHNLFFQKTNIPIQQLATNERIEHLGIFFHEKALLDRERSSA